MEQSDAQERLPDDAPPPPLPEEEPREDYNTDGYVSACNQLPFTGPWDARDRGCCALLLLAVFAPFGIGAGLIVLLLVWLLR